MDKSKADIVYGDRWIIKDGKGQLGYTSDHHSYHLLRRNYIDTSDFLMKREVMEYLGGWDEEYKRLLDWQLMIRAAKAGFSFYHASNVITDYYIHEDMLSDEKEVGVDEVTQPAWDAFDCPIRLPYLGQIAPLPKVAIFTCTYDRLEYTKKCLGSLKDKAGYPYDHFVVDNGSTDGTQEWIKKQDFKWYHLNEDNKGISIASNQALDAIKGYDIVVKVDNDALYLTDGWLKKMVDIWQTNHMIAMSCYVQGLVDNPGGAPRLHYGQIGGELMGMTRHLGGICHFVSAKTYRDFRWDETQPLHGVQDLELSQYLLKNDYSMGYLENYYCEHIDGTEGQHKRYPDYFERRKEEKTKIYDRDYDSTQKRESAHSRGTPWGERIKDSIERYHEYLHGKVLDLGCGDGYGLDVFRDKKVHATGVDLSEDKVKVAKENGHAAFVAHMEDLSMFGDKYFETIFCSHTLEHAKDAKKAVSEMKRLTNRAIVIVPIERHTTNPAHTSPFKSPQQVKELLGGTVLHEEHLNRLEPEYVCIVEW